MSKIRTRQESITSSHPKSKHFIIGLDAGYSSMKVFYENGHFCFPSYIKKVPKDMFGLPSEKDIIYEDLETKERYFVGYKAQEMIDGGSTNDTENELFSRRRYNNKSFKILCNAAIGIALTTKRDNKDIVIQTGLPAAYMDGDKTLLIKALSGPANFSIKIGGKPAQNFQFVIKENNVHVMPQPAGALYSAITKKDGTKSDDARQILSTNTLIMDPGFGTLDLFGFRSGEVCNRATADNLGMREVLSRVSTSILKNHGEDIKVPALQKYLNDYKIICVDDDLNSSEISIKKYIDESLQNVCTEAMLKVKHETNSFRGYNQMIIGGGTGEAWAPQIKESLKNLTFLSVINANRNDQSIPLLYANARGYYMALRSKNQHY